jgi:hypothetical protein
MIGPYGYSVERIDGELAALYAEHHKTASVDEVGRVVPRRRSPPSEDATNAEAA